MWWRNLINWFAGGDHPYHTLYHCMGGDTPWIALTVGLDLAVAIGYLLIAKNWWENERQIKTRNPAKVALRRLKNIFIFCGICGYLFIPVKMFWPAWRLYDMFMGVLVFITWRYALRAGDLKVIYSALEGREELEKLAAERTSALAAANDALRMQISQGEATSRALTMERNLLRTLIDALPDSIYAKNLEGQYILTNVAHAHHLGRATPEEVIGRCAGDFFSEETAAKLDRDNEAMFRFGILMLNGEEELVDAKGEKGWVSRTKVPLRDPSGQIVGLVGISRDITHRKEAESRLNALNETLEQRVAERSAAAEQRAEALIRSEEALQTQTRILRLVLCSMGDGVIVTDKGGRVILSNPVAAQWFGPELAASCADDRLPGLFLSDGETPYLPGNRPLARALRGEAVDEVEAMLRSQAPERTAWLSATGRPYAMTMEQFRGRLWCTGTSLTGSWRKQACRNRKNGFASWPSALTKSSGSVTRSRIT